MPTFKNKIRVLFYSLYTMKAYLQTGTNLGDRAAQLKEAASKIATKIGTINAISKLYETEPWGLKNQPYFYNQVLLVNTLLSPSELLRAAKEIEREMGRIDTEKWGRRVIDVDILLYEDQIIETAELVIPHPMLHKRNFCLVPLMEIAPELEHPLLKQTIEDIYWESSDDLEVIMIE
jgi:2-amino-4-hydroxy-6-hydroxymethyldihydropteridine diphosphokinase